MGYGTAKVAGKSTFLSSKARDALGEGESDPGRVTQIGSARACGTASPTILLIKGVKTGVKEATGAYGDATATQGAATVRRAAAPTEAALSETLA